MRPMLVDNHQSRLYRRQYIATFYLQMFNTRIYQTGSFLYRNGKRYRF